MKNSILFVLSIIPVLVNSQNINQEFSAFVKYNTDQALIENSYLPNKVPDLVKGIFIQQIGEGNFVFANSQAVDNDIKIEQKGNFNHLQLNAISEVVVGKVVQIGAFNTSFHSSHNSSHYEINLHQQGRNHHFESYGSNSISNDLKFKMTGESQTIIVRNFQ